LAGAAGNPIVGRLGDMFGKRRLMLVAIALWLVLVFGFLTAPLIVVVLG